VHGSPVHAPGPYELGPLGTRPANSIKEVTLRRTLATIAASVGVLIWTGALGAATHVSADPTQTNSAHTALAPLRPHQLPYNWEEDNLPPELYLWADCNAGPCDLHRERGKVDGYVGCWTALNETSLTMCPTRDGKVAYVTYS
jgi:hypothetical protein